MTTYLKILILLSSFILSSCASGEWKIKDVAPIKRTWRQCDQRLDGDLANKGFCRHQKECKKLLFGEKCRKIKQFCKYDDMECKRKNQIDRMVLKTRDLL